MRPLLRKFRGAQNHSLVALAIAYAVGTPMPKTTTICTLQAGPCALALSHLGNKVLLWDPRLLGSQGLQWKFGE